MERESFSHRQASAVLMMFIFGSTLIFNVGNHVKQDIWISFTIALIMFVPFMLMYARICRLFPGKNLFDIFEELFGRIFGKILTGVITWYALYMTATVLRNLLDFVWITTLSETPPLAIAVAMLAVIIYLTRCGTEVFGKWAVITLIILMSVVPFTILVSLPAMEWSNLLPILGSKWDALFMAAFQQFAMPLGETVLFLGIANSLRKGNSPYKAYLYGVLLAGIINIMILLRNIAILGTAMLESVYFPSYATGRTINLGEFFARIESLISINFLFAGITKLAFCIIVASKGITGLFNLSSYKRILVPVSLFCLALSIVSYRSTMHLLDFMANYYPVYAFGFQVIIPVLTWITAEAKKGRPKTG